MLVVSNREQCLLLCSTNPCKASSLSRMNDMEAFWQRPFCSSVFMTERSSSFTDSTTKVVSRWSSFLRSKQTPQSVTNGLRCLGLDRYWHWVIGYWAIFADIGWYCYWVIFFFIVTPNMIPIRQQSALSTPYIHMWRGRCQQMTAGRVGRCRVQAIQYIIIIIEFWDFTCIVLYIFRFKINTLLCYTVVLVLSISIARGQYYWILGALFGIVLTLKMSIPFWHSFVAGMATDRASDLWSTGRRFDFRPCGVCSLVLGGR